VYSDTILYVKGVKRTTSIAGSPTSAAPMAARSSRTGVVKRLAVVAAAALVSVAIWTGAPLLALWVGSHFEGWIPSRAPGSGVTMRAVFVVVIVLAALEFVLALALARLNARYEELIGRPRCDAGTRGSAACAASERRWS
jgi:hypothetical protein